MRNYRGERARLFPLITRWAAFIAPPDEKLISQMELKLMNELMRKRLTSLLCCQYMAKGDSGEFRTMHVRLMVDPVLMKISGPPIIVVNGSAKM